MLLRVSALFTSLTRDKHHAHEKRNLYKDMTFSFGPQLPVVEINFIHDYVTIAEHPNLMPLPEQRERRGMQLCTPDMVGDILAMCLSSCGAV